MAYALVIGGVIQAVRNPGRIEIKLSDGARLGPPDTGWTPELAALCGFVLIVEVARPADTPTHTYDRSVTLVAGVPTETWTQRPKTQVELDAQTAATNRTTIEQQASDALATNTTYIALASPTNAQVTAQVKTLTRQNNKIIRLILNKLDGTD